jgi:hypothetical protein
MLYYWKISYNKFWRPPRPPQLTAGCHLCSKNATAQLGTEADQGGPGRTGGHSRPWRPRVVRELPDLSMIYILNIIYFLQIVTNHNTSFIFKEKIVRVRFINEYLFQWYQFIIVSFIDDFSRFFRFDNVVFHLRNF